MKIMKYISHPLGMGRGTGTERDSLVPVSVGQPKMWILTAIGTAASLASSLIGGAASSRAAKAAERRQRAQEAKEEAWYNRRYNESYVDTAAGQNLVRRAKEHARENWRKAAGEQAVSGGTAAAAQMAKDAGNKMVGDTIANMAALDTQRKDNADNQHRQAEQNFAQMDMQREMQRAQNITNAAQGASSAIMSAAGALEQTGAKTDIASGGSNNSKVVTPPTVTTIDRPRYNGMGVEIDDPLDLNRSA